MGLCVILTVIMYTTTMYIAFNPVGHTELVINGVQGRYFLPILFAAFYALHRADLRLPVKQDLYNAAALLIPAIVLYSGMYDVLKAML